MTTGTNAERRVASPLEVFDRARRCVVARDANGFADLFASDGIMEFPFGGATGLAPFLEGREQIRSRLGAAWRGAGRRVLAYDAVVVHQTSDPEVIIVEFDLQGEVTATGEKYRLPHVQVFRIRSGAIASMRDYVATGRTSAVMQRGAADAGFSPTRPRDGGSPSGP